jgi:hypothetical protein
MIYEAIHVCIARIAGFLWGVGSDRSDRNLQEDFISPAGLVLGIASTPLTRASPRNKNRERTRNSLTGAKVAQNDINTTSRQP